MTQDHLSLFLSIIFLNFLSFLTYGIPVAYFPNVAKNRGISAMVVGVIFSMYPLGAFFSGFHVGKMLDKWDRKKVIIYSQLVMGLSIITFGLSSLIDDNFLFVAIALLTRTSQGGSLGAYQTAAYAYVPEFWPDEIELRVGLLEMTVGFGIGAGPLIGAMIYGVLGYLSIFIGPGVIIACIGSVVAYFILPQNKKREESYEETLSIKASFSRKEMWYTFTAMIFNYIPFTLIMPELENEVVEKGGSPEKASLVFACNQLGYALAIAVLIISRQKNAKAIYFVGLILTIVSMVIMGSDEIISVSNENHLFLLAFGMFLIGIVNALALIPSISEFISILETIFPDTSKHLIDNMASGVFTAAISCAEFIGPILGGILSDFYGFSMNCLIYGVIVFFFLIMYGWDGQGMKAFMKVVRRRDSKKEEGRAIEIELLETRFML